MLFFQLKDSRENESEARANPVWLSAWLGPIKRREGSIRIAYWLMEISWKVTKRRRSPQKGNETDVKWMHLNMRLLHKSPQESRRGAKGSEGKGQRRWAGVRTTRQIYMDPHLGRKQWVSFSSRTKGRRSWSVRINRNRMFMANGWRPLVRFSWFLDTNCCTIAVQWNLLSIPMDQWHASKWQ